MVCYLRVFNKGRLKLKYIWREREMLLLILGYKGREIFNFCKNICVNFREIYEGKIEGFVKVLVDFIVKFLYSLN